MAVGNALVTTAKFRPLSYNEWAAPLKELNTQHAAEEAALESLSEDASKYERYIRANPDSEVARQYRDFLDQIEAEADALSKYGISPDRRTSLANLRRSYNQNVKPIRTAVETLDDIEKQYIKDSKKLIIGAPDIDVNYLLEHPEYTVSDYKKSYVLGDDVLKYSSNLFKGLTGWDTTPTTQTSPDGSYAYIFTPQGYTTEDYITAITGQGNGKVTPELENAVKTARDNFNYDSLDEVSKNQIDRLLLSAASKYTKEAKTTIRNAPKGHRITSEGKVEPKYKGYTPVVTDSGEVLYKKNNQYYKPSQGNDGNTYMSPVTSDVQMGGRTFKQKPNASAGTLVADTNSTVSSPIPYMWSGVRVPFAPLQSPTSKAAPINKEPVVTEEDSEGFDW